MSKSPSKSEVARTNRIIKNMMLAATALRHVPAFKLGSFKSRDISTALLEDIARIAPKRTIERISTKLSIQLDDMFILYATMDDDN